MIKFAFVFRSSPFGSANSREGLDALLAASAFCDEAHIAVFFLEDGVFNLLREQQATRILQKEVTSVLKLLDLYEITQRYVCEQDLHMAEMTVADCVIACEVKERNAIFALLNQAEKILTF